MTELTDESRIERMLAEGKLTAEDFQGTTFSLTNRCPCRA